MDVNTLINKIPSPERPAFITKVTQVAKNIGVSFNDLMAIMDLESAGTFDPGIQNKLGYTGLIQFGSTAARDLGTTTDALKKMTRIQQMDYVERYFKLWMNRLRISKLQNFVDMYLVVFYPAGIKEQDPNKPFSTPAVEVANPALRDASGHITKNSIKATYEKRYQGLFDKAVEVVKKNSGLIVLGVILSTIALYVLYYELYRDKSVLASLKA